MEIKSIKNELQNIFSGKNLLGQDSIIQTTACHLRGSQSAGPMAEEKHQNKSKEKERLIRFALGA